MIDGHLQLLAAKYIRRQAKELASQFKGLRAGDDVEFVHRARVAIRRLRAALAMNDGAFAPGQLRRWNKAIRRAASKLGAARDFDVQLEFVRDALLSLKDRDTCLGVATILVQCERDRRRLQPSVVRAVDRLESKAALRQVRCEAKAVLRAAQSAGDGAQSVSARAAAREHIVQRIDELCREAESLADANDQQGHHAMRIATKRLRYTVEIVRPVFGRALDDSLNCAKKLQTLLGDIHDCDVWAVDLDALVATEGKGLSRLHAGIDYLRENRRRHRDETFQELVSYWAELMGRGFWDEVKAAISAMPEAENTSKAMPEIRAVGVELPEASEVETAAKPPLTVGS